jgi:inosine-uridine nucleoside N-ribohydrolase
MQSYNLTDCIPLYLGAQQPLLRTYDTFQEWERLFGNLVWQGAFQPGYEDTYTWDNVTNLNEMPGAIALIEAVKKYKDTDPITIYMCGLATTVAQALSIYPQMVNETAGIFMMGGYVDVQLAAATAKNSITIDINTDINLMQDPEAAQMVLTAGWKELYIGGNVTNYLVPSQTLYNKIIERAGGMEIIDDSPYLKYVLSLLGTGNYTENNDQQTLPFWDEVVSAYMSWPDMILETSDITVAVDTSFYSPFYGSLRVWNPEWAPTAGVKVANATLVDKIDDEMFYNLLIDNYFKNWTQYCEVYGPVELIL